MYTHNTALDPQHYKVCSLECIQVMRVAFGDAAVTDFCIVNAFKYCWRYQYKNGLEDLDKAGWYLDKAEEIHMSQDHTQRIKSMRTLLNELKEANHANDRASKAEDITI